MELSDVRFGYGDHPVYEHLDLVMERGEKVALVGPNGAGKSTLLKLIAGVLQPAAGERKLGHKVELAYFAQHQVEALSPNNTVLQELRSAIPPGVEADARALLGRFLFSGDDVDKPIAVLSGGERTRVALAKLLVSPVNLLCVDEPTNHLDMWSRDVLEEALTEYTGNIVLITHDRHLIRSIAGRIVEVVEGRVTNYAGDYAYYLSKQVEAAPETPAARPETKEQKRQEAEERGRLKGLKERVRSIEAKLEEVTVELRGFEQTFAAPDVYSSGADVADITKRYEAAKRRAARLETEWTEAVQTLESSGT
jgi:ATP-binding cassette subfamily F protein 3